MKDRPILVLGGGSSQLALLRGLARRGMRTLLCDVNPGAPGRSFASDFAPVSTFDIPAVLEAARQYGAAGITTMGTDQPVYTAAVVADALGLPTFLDPPTARLVTHKGAMKDRLSAAGIPTRPYRLINSETTVRDLAELVPPLVVKPLDSQGQRGVLRVGGAAEALDRGPEVLSFSRETEYLVEEYYPSTEVTVSGWCRRGRAAVFSITDRVTVEEGAHIGVCLSHRFPSRHLPAYERELLSLTQGIVDACGLREGPLYFQMLIGERGIVVNEIACRLGGAYEDEVIPLITGADTVDLLIEGALGRHPREIPISYHQMARIPAVSVPLLFCLPGEIGQFRGVDGVARLHGVETVKVLQPEGTRIGPLKNSTQRALYLVVRGEDPETLNRTLEEVNRRLSVSDTRGREMLKPWLALARHPIITANRIGAAHEGQELF